jgi:hypothetical protein
MLSIDNEVIRDIVFAVMASLAKIDARRSVREHGPGCSEQRPREAARAAQDQCGQPHVEMLGTGEGIRATARAVGTGNERVHRIAREMRRMVSAS